MTPKPPRPERRLRPKPKLSGVPLPAIFLLVGLLILPSLAVIRLTPSIVPRVVWGYALALSVVAYLVNCHDKRQAESGGQRTPESTLHLIEFMGGWPGAFLAQRALRHKTAKTSYRISFWTIVASHEAVAFDFLQQWRFVRAAISLFHQ